MAKRQTAADSGVGDNGDLQALFDSITEQAAGKPPKLEVVASSDGAGDSDELENLFDSVAATGGAAKKVVAAAPAAPAQARASEEVSGDSDDLEALFDQVASGGDASAARSAGDSDGKQENVFTRIGQMTRLLHDTIRELGYDRMLEETAQKLPDARQRLSYISQMTEQAASRVLNATDIAKPIQDRVERSSVELNARWEKLYSKELSVDEFKALASDTRSFFQQSAADSQVVNAQLLEIVADQPGIVDHAVARRHREGDDGALRHALRLGQHRHLRLPPGRCRLRW